MASKTPVDKENPWISKGQEVEVQAEFCKDKSTGRSDVDGCQGSWRRARVIEVHGPINTASAHVTIQLHLCQPMYDDEDDSKPVHEDPNVDGYTDSETEGEEDEQFGLNSYEARKWRVPLKALRPFCPFSAWAEEPLGAFQAGDRVLYTDGQDECMRWIAYVRRVFSNGLWIYVPGSQDWDMHEHHCLVAQDGAAILQQRHDVQFGANTVSKRAFPMSRHLRRDRAFDVRSGRWKEHGYPRKFFKPLIAPVAAGPVVFYPQQTWLETFEECAGPSADEQPKSSSKRPQTSSKSGEPAKHRPRPKTDSGATIGAAPRPQQQAPKQKEAQQEAPRRPWHSHPQEKDDSEEEEQLIRRTLRREVHRRGWLDGCPNDPHMPVMFTEVMRNVVLPQSANGRYSGPAASLLEPLMEDFEGIERELLSVFT